MSDIRPPEGAPIRSAQREGGPVTAIVLVGGGGHCQSCMAVLQSAGREIAGVIDVRRGVAPPGTVWLGDDAWLDTNAARDFVYLVSVGLNRVGPRRAAIYEAILQRGLSLATAVASSAVVAPGASIGPGTIVMHQAVVNAGARIGANCIVNTAAIVEHGAVLGDHCHAAPGSIVNGDAQVGSGSMIGAGAVLLPGTRIGANVMVGAGCVVTRDLLEDGTTWAGAPARKLS
ncbi:MAG TPA: acetyltransferase [Ramlibacter sp.]|uniref:acetyltransferase n=1 Tax=Ramlibacter sp. TaxID=1917967 RepID=UPI002C5C53B6|nr:acetyltransferase [Ramlibacter sp.]HVZ45349.1 acetyltransferase [Ramlibacter sp.]